MAIVVIDNELTEVGKEKEQGYWIKIRFHLSSVTGSPTDTVIGNPNDIAFFFDEQNPTWEDVSIQPGGLNMPGVLGTPLTHIENDVDPLWILRWKVNRFTLQKRKGLKFHTDTAGVGNWPIMPCMTIVVELRNVTTSTGGQPSKIRMHFTWNEIPQCFVDLQARPQREGRKGVGKSEKNQPVIP